MGEKAGKLLLFPHFIPTKIRRVRLVRPGGFFSAPVFTCSLPCLANIPLMNKHIGSDMAAEKNNRFLFEHYAEPLLPRKTYWIRIVKHGGIASLLLALSMLGGMIGYHLIAGLSWIDSFLNASMILTGMGPVNQLQTTWAKLFAGLYALYSGIAFLTCAGILFGPVVHRVMHKFHLGN